MSECVLDVRDVVREYKLPGQKPIRVLNGVCLAVSAGEHVAITGRSGAGKSTLLNILGGLDRPTSGTVTCVPARGFVFQSFHLMPELTVFENVYLPTMAGHAHLSRRQARSRADSLLKRVGLAERRDHLPAELSGGEQQRVAIARALMCNPEIIFADEPTGNLDRMTGAEILSLILSEGEGMSSPAVVMVTHSPEAAAACDRQLELTGGVLQEMTKG